MPAKLVALHIQRFITVFLGVVVLGLAFQGMVINNVQNEAVENMAGTVGMIDTWCARARCACARVCFLRTETVVVLDLPLAAVVSFNPSLRMSPTLALPDSFCSLGGRSSSIDGGALTMTQMAYDCATGKGG